MAPIPFPAWNEWPNQTILTVSCNPGKGMSKMFVRAVWRSRRLVDTRQTLREMDVPSTKNSALLGVSGPDFPKMTRGLFDRQH